MHLARTALAARPSLAREGLAPYGGLHNGNLASLARLGTTCIASGDRT